MSYRFACCRSAPTSFQLRCRSCIKTRDASTLLPGGLGTTDGASFFLSPPSSSSAAPEAPPERESNVRTRSRLLCRRSSADPSSGSAHIRSMPSTPSAYTVADPSSFPFLDHTRTSNDNCLPAPLLPSPSPSPPWAGGARGPTTNDIQNHLDSNGAKSQSTNSSGAEPPADDVPLPARSSRIRPDSVSSFTDAENNGGLRVRSTPSPSPSPPSSSLTPREKSVVPTSEPRTQKDTVRPPP
mmetsp:Transcript_6792/g.20193  ORF Transcript_6792/g.20193 Transcript_6792/m.20193 type:complete len:240 (+) Transcript_6792:216-935(+)